MFKSFRYIIFYLYICLFIKIFVMFEEEEENIFLFIISWWKLSKFK